MAEFVEYSLEKLLPAFESLISSKLFSKAEVDDRIKHFRRYEYQSAKQTKTPNDYLQYTSYITNFLRDIHNRRKAVRCRNFYDDIERPIKNKCAFLFQLCTQRFKERELFMKEIEFLTNAKMYGLCSLAYARLLQFYGSDVKYHEAAGRFEFFQGRSVENARVILHTALRKFPEDMGLWNALFVVELHYVKYVLERRKFLKTAGAKVSAKKTKEKGGPKLKVQEVRGIEEIPDAVLNFQLAEVVHDQAYNALPSGKNEFLYYSWEATYKAGSFAASFEKKLYDKMLAIEPPTEECVLAKCQKEKNLTSYELYDAALERMVSPKLIRLYVEFCKKKCRKDTFAPIKLVSLYEKLDELREASSDDYRHYFALVGSTKDDELDRHVGMLERAVKVSPKCTELWERLLTLKTDRWLASRDNGETDEDNLPTRESAEFKELKRDFDDTLKNIPKEESRPTWEKLLKLAMIAHSPEEVEKVFNKAFTNAPQQIASELRALWVTYVAELEPDDSDAYRSAYKKMSSIRPTSITLHYNFIALEERRQSTPDRTLVERAHESVVQEFGQTSVEAWINYLKYTLNVAPELVGHLNKRALINLDPSLADEFKEKWTLICRKG